MYGIGLASRLTGVPVETIRIWERRYNLPQPRRSVGGHRQFSDEDVDLLRALKALVDAGARIGQLANETPEQLLAAAHALTGDIEGEPPAAAPDFGELVADVIEATRRQDTDLAAQLLDRPLLHRHPREVMLGLYLPVLREVGELWHAGEISIASEHFVEKLITGRIHAVLANRSRQEGPPAVLACLPGERHEAALLAACVLLELGGFSVTYLGADLPASDLESVVAAKRPRLVVLSATVEPTDETAREVVAACAARDVTVVVGGAAGAALAAASDGRITALGSLEELEEVAATIAGAS
jgi:DNA-binding transcriptional MerR regulator/methylmalonyl-CoA mutase cobalamin-binding subunit